MSNSSPLGDGQKALAYGSMPCFRLGTGTYALRSGQAPAGRIGKVARQYTLARQLIWVNPAAALRQSLPEPFVVPEQEQLVLLERASQRSPKLIALKRSLVYIKDVPRVQGAVAQKLEDVSMQLVGSGGGHNADLGTGPFPIFGAIGVGDGVVFPHRFHSQQLPAGAVRRNELPRTVPSHPVDPVDQKPVDWEGGNGTGQFITPHGSLPPSRPR